MIAVMVHDPAAERPERFDNHKEATAHVPTDGGLRRACRQFGFRPLLHRSSTFPRQGTARAGELPAESPQGGEPYLVAELFWPSQDAFKAYAATRESADPQPCGGRGTTFTTYTGDVAESLTDRTYRKPDHRKREHRADGCLQTRQPHSSISPRRPCDRDLAALSGTFDLGGDLPVVRLGYGAMQLHRRGRLGPAGRPRRGRPRPAPRRRARASTSSTPPTPTARTSPRS